MVKENRSLVPEKLPPSEYSGFITVRLSPEVPIPSEESKTLSDASRELGLSGLERVLDEYGVSASSRRIRSLSPEEILKLEREAMQSEFPPLHSLTAYWRLDIRDRPELMDELLERLNSLSEIEKAYEELPVSEPVVNAADDPYNATQGYLDAAPTGIDARWAWTQPNGEGAGIGFVDLEQGWFLGHEDYASKSPTLIYGDNRDGVGLYKGNHGTAVLGEVMADDSTVGVVGIAPSCASVQVTSHYDNATDTNLHVDDAILAAIPTMNVGDVLLLEVQRGSGPWPTEVDDADFDAIRLAVAIGIVVVEAAGNGSEDLDAYTDPAGDSILNRASADFRDSGAIMVGAAESVLPHNRLGFSNHGTRVDCYAWGENVTTCGYGDLDAGGGNDNKTYTDTFGGTSSASPIVTGAAMILQGMYEANTGSRLSPVQMRVLLSEPATGTPQGGGVAGNIGVMPNLRAIIESAQQLPAFQYAVKFVCGRSTGEAVAPGIYFTAINVHNPTNEAIRFRKKVAVALPGEQPGPVSQFFDAKLGPDQAFEIDCQDIRRHAQTSADFLKGFVVIESDVELDVVAVYTAARDIQVETIHTERVAPRKRREQRVRLPDLVPVPDPQFGFCRMVEQGPDKGKLTVTIKNQGDADAPGSITKVIFAPGGTVDIPTPPISAGASVDLPPIDIPGICFNPDCNFRIVVDANREVVESNEANNTASGLCLG